MLRALLILILSLSLYLPVKGQTGTEFWFAAPEVSVGHAGDTPIVFRLTTFDSTTTVRISQPARYLDTTITIPPNTHYTYDLSDSLDVIENKPTDSILTYGLRIEADFPITAYYEVNAEVSNNPDIFALKAGNALGKEFVTPFQDVWPNAVSSYNPDPYSEMIIVATEDNTDIFIQPNCDVVGGHAANQTYSITLDKGETYSAEDADDINTTNNLSGSVITSNKPIAVTVKDGSVAHPDGCRDIMGDQTVPVDVVGKEYIITQGSLNGERAFVVATQNNTTVSLDDGAVTTTTLNKGDMFTYDVDQPLTYITGDKPIYVLHASGFGCEIGEAILPPLNCAGSDRLSFTRSTDEYFGLNLLVRSGAEGDFVLNGDPTLINAGDFSPVPGTGGNWMGARLSFNTTDVPSGVASNIINNTDIFSMGIINGSATGGCRYGYFSEFAFKTFVDAGADQTVCANADIQLNGSISGGSTTGVWETLGSGSFSDSSDLNATYAPSIADTTNGSVTLVLTSTGTCAPEDDTVTYTFSPAPVVDAGPDQNVCANDPQVSLNGSVSFAAGGEWTNGGGGSFSPGNTDLNATFTPSPAQISSGGVTLALTSLGNGDCNAVTDSIDITIGPAPQVDAGADQTVCANNDTVDLNGSVSGGTTTGQWSSSGTGAFIPNNTSLTGSYLPDSADVANGTVTLTLVSTNNGNCLPEEDSMEVTITDAPVVDAGPDDTICANSTASLNGSVSGPTNTGTWSTSGTGTFNPSPTDLSANYTPSANDTAMGSVYLTLTSTSNGNCLPAEDSLLLTITNEPEVSANGPDTICSSNFAQVNASSSTGNGSWTTLGDGNFLPSDTIMNTRYYPGPSDTANGTVDLVFHSESNGECQPVSDTITIGIIPGPTADFTTSDLCLNETVQFTNTSTFGAGSITSYQWDLGDGDSSTTQNPTHDYQNEGAYDVSLIVTGSNGCTDTLNRNLFISDIQAGFEFDDVCINQKTEFTDVSQVTGGTVSAWDWDFGDGNTSGVQNPDHTYPEEGAYPVTLIATSSTGCSDTVTQAVDIIPGPDADMIVDKDPVFAGEEVNFLDVSAGNPVFWNWHFGDSSEVATKKNPVHIYESTGSYEIMLVIEDQFGCLDTAFHRIDVFAPPSVPSGFSPNGDGENDILYVLGGPYKDLEFKIYNNWGELIFISEDQDQGWDGTRNGVKQPVGVYVYVVKAVTPDGKEYKITGDVTLLR